MDTLTGVAVGGDGQHGLGFFYVSEVLAGSHLTHGGPMALERLKGESWVEIGRYGTAEESALGLDEQIARGVDASDLRLRPLESKHHKKIFRRRTD